MYALVKQRVMKMDIDCWPKNPKANFLRDWVTVSSAYAESYETDLDFWLKNPKAKTKPNKPNFKAAISKRFLAFTFLCPSYNLAIQNRTIQKPLNLALCGKKLKNK
jgi:hypothetical protein